MLFGLVCSGQQGQEQDRTRSRRSQAGFRCLKPACVTIDAHPSPLSGEDAPFTARMMCVHPTAALLVDVSACVYHRTAGPQRQRDPDAARGGACAIRGDQAHTCAPSCTYFLLRSIPIRVQRTAHKALAPFLRCDGTPKLPNEHETLYPTCAGRSTATGRTTNACRTAAPSQADAAHFRHRH